eukprot:gnl/Chilomastix_caulleri/4402.p1 GENE.gnl/Chilomastix_caulleri/4402~~gnl/Chilomastix_caulleri/4402.p1  ORF type:complete len:83 (+),score=13.89 gnl/Chilomastix_caulleri/4402:97-345(+)
MEDKKKIEVPEEAKFRIILSSSEKDQINETTNDLVQSIRKNSLKMRGPVGCPIKKLNITTRKSPCGEGTNTYEHWQMRIYKR